MYHRSLFHIGPYRLSCKFPFAAVIYGLHLRFGNGKMVSPGLV